MKLLPCLWKSRYATGKYHYENLRVDGRIILKFVAKTYNGRGVHWTHLALDRNQWRALVKTVRNLRIL
jgi:hypothetical protein